MKQMRIWVGRLFTLLTVLCALFDAAGKLDLPTPVTDAFTRLGLPVQTAMLIGLILLFSTLLYAIPRSSLLGAILLTGYLGGAVALQLRAGSTVPETAFPVVFGCVAWAGLFLRNPYLAYMLIHGADTGAGWKDDCSASVVLETE